MGNTWCADIADMQLISKYNKGINFFDWHICSVTPRWKKKLVGWNTGALKRRNCHCQFSGMKSVHEQLAGVLVGFIKESTEA